MQNNNATRVLTRFVSALAVPVTRQTISDELERHPNYDSLLAFSDVLDIYKISNAAYQVPADQLAEVQLPFIAHLSQTRFGLITSYNEENVRFTDDTVINKRLATSEFKKLYGGTVLVAEKGEHVAEPDYAKKRTREQLLSLRLPIAFTGISFLLIMLFLQRGNLTIGNALPLIALFFIKTLGLICSIMLLMQGIDANNPLIRRFCGGDDSKSCNTVLS